MKRLLSATAITALMASSSIAGSVSFVAPTPTVIAEPVSNDWAGFSIGAKYVNTFDVTQGYYFNDVFTSNRALAGTLAGGFVGYNFQRNNLVYGVELAYAPGEVNRSDGGGRPDNRHTYYVDAKLRGGYAFGDALLFATVGWAGTNWQENVRGNASTSGISYGVGIDYKIWKDLFVGAEYVHRELTSENFPWSASNEYFNSSMESFEIRLGWNF